MSCHRLAAVACVTVTALTLAACTDGADRSTGRLTAEGRAEVSSRGASWRAVTGTIGVKAGDRVRVVDGMATLTLNDQRALQLRRGSELEVGGATSSNVIPSLVSGEFLAEAPEGGLRLDAGESSVSVDGVARVSRGLTVVVASYAGSATISSAGRELVVPALYQAAVPAVGLLPSQGAPLSYTPGDPWDERFLGEAIQLGDELAARSRGFSAQLRPEEAISAAFYRQLIPALSEQPEVDGVVEGSNREPGEMLVGLAIAVEGAKGSFSERVQEIFSFHDEGASWGIVALQQGVSRVKVLITVDAALSRGPTLVAEAPVTPVTPSSSESVLALPAPSDDTSPAAEPSPSGSGATPGSSAPASSPLPNEGPLRLGVPAVDNTVNSLVDVLSGLLSALGR